MKVTELIDRLKDMPLQLEVYADLKQLEGLKEISDCKEVFIVDNGSKIYMDFKEKGLKCVLLK